MNRPGSGALRARVVIEQEAPAATSGGGYAPNWTELATVWAQIQPMTGREVLQGERLESRTTHRLVLRFRADVTAGMRVRWQNMIFNINSVTALDLRERLMQLLVTAGGAA